MNERIIVNGEDLDLLFKDELTLNIKVNDISDISTRNSTYSNTNKIPRTAKNTRIFEYLGIIGNASETPYKKVRCKYLKNGITIIENGLLQVTKTSEDYFFINVFDGIIDFKERIKDKKISELNIAVTSSHVRSQTSVTNSFNNTSGYIYAIQSNVKKGDFPVGVYPLGISGEGRAILDKMIPVYFVKTVFEAILSEAGYEFQGEIFEDPEFASEVFTMGKGSEDDVIDFVLMFPEVTQTAFVKDVMNRYGLLVRPIGIEENQLEFTSFEKVVNGEFGVVDWTKKLIEIKEEKYKPPYAQRNIFTYSYSDDSLNEADGIIPIVNENLKGEKVVYRSFFDYKDLNILYRIVSITEFKNIPYVPLIEISIEDGVEVFKAATSKSGLFKINKTGDDIDIAPDSNSAYVTVSGGEVLLENSEVRMTKFLNDNYVRIQQIFSDYKELTATFKLDNIDLFNLDLFKTYFISQKGQYYYINGIKLSKGISTANMIQINGLLEQNEVILPPDESEIIITGIQVYTANPPFTFTQGFITSYEVLEFNPLSLIITYTQLDGQNGSPTGLVFTDQTATQTSTHNQGISILSEDVCGWYRVKIVDPDTGIESNEFDVLLPCPVDPPPVDEIIINSYYFDPPTDPTRIGYRFNNFTPTFATLRIWAYNFITGQTTGSPTVTSLPNLTEGVSHILNNVNLPSGSVGWYHVEIETNVLTETYTGLL